MVYASNTLFPPGGMDMEHRAYKKQISHARLNPARDEIINFHFVFRCDFLFLFSRRAFVRKHPYKKRTFIFNSTLIFFFLHVRIFLSRFPASIVKERTRTRDENQIVP